MSDEFDFSEGDLVRVNLNADRKGILDAVCIGFQDLANDRRRAVFEVPGLNPTRVSLAEYEADFQVIGEADD